MTLRLTDLSEELQKEIVKSYQLKNKAVYRRKMLANKIVSSGPGGLFGSSIAPKTEAKIKESTIIWGTDNYSHLGEEYDFNSPINDLSVIVPRVQKSKEEQKRRSKQKAEIFTPAWVCNLQNNLIDDEVLYPNAFNTVNQETKKEWTPTDKVDFTKTSTHWLDYIVEKRLEATCGEGPYLMSPYEATLGEIIPLKDSKNRFNRIGLLDRKLRVISENASKAGWVNYAKLALYSTFGYEWQGDNLILARLNFLNTFRDYYKDFFNEEPSDALLLEVAEIASWNLWQMDGLKMVVPMTCSKNCIACLKKKNGGHDGEVSLVRFYTEVKTFEELLPADRFELGKKK